jgi:RNase H-fold protein (predicted Holliday junction resolvase)
VALSGVSTLVAIVALLLTAARSRRADTAALAERLARLETKVDVFWRGVSFDAARLLHSPHPKFARRDHLLEQFMAERLTGVEARELTKLMSEVLKDNRSDPGQRMAASVVLRYLAAWYDNAESGG